MTLTKEELMAGKDLVYDVEILDPKGTVKVRPLTALEYSKVMGKKFEGVKGKQATGGIRDSGIEIDLQKTTLNDLEGDSLAISIAAIDPSISQAEAKGLMRKTFVQIVKEIYRISGVAKPEREQVDPFRGDQ